MERPTLDEVIDQIRDVSGAQRIDPDTPLLTIENIDSLDLVEWLYGFQEKNPHIPVDESLFEDIDESVTLRTIYERLMATAPAVTPGAGAAG